MINNNTLLELNKTEFGASINRLESYLIDTKQFEIISGQQNYDNKTKRYKEILKSIKPKSLMFSSKTDLEEIENTKYDKLLVDFPESMPMCIYGASNDNILNAYKHIVDHTNSIGITAIPSVVGIAVSVTYISGNLYKVYVVRDSVKLMDITNDVKSLLPSYIDAIKDNNITDFRGKITTKGNKLTNEIDIIHRLRTHINTNELQFIFYCVYSDTRQYGSSWEMIEFIKGTELSVPHHALIRNIDCTLMMDAVIQLKEFFTDLNTKEQFPYTYNGIQIINNQNSKSFIYNYMDCPSNKIFESTVKSILINSNTSGMYATIKIVDTKCNDELVISSIDVNDVLDFVNFNISIGSKVQFYISDRKAYLYKS